MFQGKDVHMHRRRVRKLYDHMTSLPPRTLAMGVWGPRCPSWHAVQVFHDEGLRFWRPASNIPAYKDKVGMAALAEFFELSDEDVEHLFRSRPMREDEHETIIRRFGAYLGVGWEHLMEAVTQAR